jgi:hypothetical protein
MKINFITFKLRVTTLESVQNLLEKGKFLNEKTALKYISSLKKPFGYDNTKDFDKVYQDYRAFKHSLKKNH